METTTLVVSNNLKGREKLFFRPFLKFFLTCNLIWAIVFLTNEGVAKWLRGYGVIW